MCVLGLHSLVISAKFPFTHVTCYLVNFALSASVAWPQSYTRCVDVLFHNLWHQGLEAISNATIVINVTGGSKTEIITKAKRSVDDLI